MACDEKRYTRNDFYNELKFYKNFENFTLKCQISSYEENFIM